MSIRILLVDDHSIFRQGLRVLLDKKEGFEVVGEAENGRVGYPWPGSMSRMSS
jgi:DNA-binding NarL/FixJ family response regulator